MKLRSQKLNGLLVLPALLTLVLAGCTPTRKAPPTTAQGYVPTSIEQLRGNTEAFRDQRVVFDAYILGMEYGTNTDDADQWIMVLGLEPLLHKDGVGGVLIEDLILVTAKGGERISTLDIRPWRSAQS